MSHATSVERVDTCGLISFLAEGEDLPVVTALPLETRFFGGKLTWDYYRKGLGASKGVS